MDEGDRQEIEEVVERVINKLRRELVEEAAQSAIDKIAATVGKGVVERVLYLVGAIVIALLLWAGKNHLEIK